MHISLYLGAVCIGQSPCTFEFNNNRSFDYEVCAQITNHMILKHNGYYAFGLVVNMIFSQKNLQGIVIDALGITRAKCSIDFGN